MTYDRKSEVETIFEADETRLGETWRAHRLGHSVAEIASEQGTTDGPVYANLRLIAALTDGEVATAPTVAVEHASRIRSWLRNKPLSDELRDDLTSQERALTAIANDRTQQIVEDEAAVEASQKAEAAKVAGIYVYTLPHYWRYKVDPDNDQTYLKVGKSQSDVFTRVGEQRTTALPEDPWLLRIYPTENASELERKFHTMLEAADHRRAVSKRGGREWFLTSLRILDWYASDQGLEIRRPNESTLGDE